MPVQRGIRVFEARVDNRARYFSSPLFPLHLMLQRADSTADIAPQAEEKKCADISPVDLSRLKMAPQMKRPVSRREYWRVRAKARRTRRDAQEVSFDSSMLSQSCGFNVYVHERAVDLSAAQMRTLRGDACALRARHGAASFFLPLSAAVDLASEPRHPASPGCSPALLRYVAQLLLSELQDQQDRARLHIAGLLDGGTCGAEFWVQRRAAGEHAINWHWDKDESLLDSSGLTAHPLVSTVTYLTSGGAPTVVLDARTDEHGRLLPPGEGSWEGGAIAATVSYPKSRRLLRFDGRLLHGCPPQLAGPEAVGSARFPLPSLSPHAPPARSGRSRARTANASRCSSTSGWATARSACPPRRARRSSACCAACRHTPARCSPWTPPRLGTASTSLRRGGSNPSPLPLSHQPA